MCTQVTIGVLLVKPICRCDRCIGDFKGSGFNVDRYNPAMVAFLNLRSHLRLVELITTSRKFFFAVARLPDCHSLVA
jgi:hypothetical protein